jgi:ABC-type lipoprotein export system ATPase subunit
VTAPAIDGRDLFLVHRGVQGDVSALRGLDVTVARGERIAVLGPSGAGKTSLLRLCAGFARPSSGRLRVDGLAIESSSPKRLAQLRRASLGIITQHFNRSLPSELTAREIAALPLSLTGRLDDAGRRRARGLLRAAGLGDRLDALPGELSGGEQQRVAICAALVKRPRIVLADEPTGELDEPSSIAVVDLMFHLSDELEASVVVVTHDLRVARRADRIVHVRDGRVSAEGSAEQAVVVDDHGWLRLPRELREQAGIGRHVQISAAPSGLLLQPLGERPAPSAAPRRVVAPGERVAGPVVRIAGAAKAYGSRVVFDGLRHVFAPGRLHVVAGPSGTGKTTLLLMLAALESPDRGSILCDELDVVRLDVDRAAAWRRRAVGYLNQHTLLAGHLTALENVTLAVELRGAGRERAAQVAGGWLEWVGLGDAMRRRAAGMSGGEQRRVALAQALAGAPALLIVDEPTAHLDRANGRRVIEILRGSAHGLGATVVASTHDPDLIEAADGVLDLGG